MSVQFEIEKFESGALENVMGNYWMRVSDQIHLVNRFVFLEWASARVIAGWVPAAKEFEWKSELTRMMWQNMSFASQLRTRKEELSGNSKVLIPSEALQTFIQDVSRADGFFPFLAGWFLEVSKAQVDAYERFLEALDPIFDAPTIDIVEDVLPKKRKQIAWAKGLVHEAVKDRNVLERVEAWRGYTRAYLRQLGGIDERDRASASPAAPARPEVEAYGPAPAVRTMPDWLKPGDFNEPPAEVRDNLKIFMWHYMTEIQVVDPMCYVFYGVPDMPFEFYYDFSRHIWDETRHHQMGVRRLTQMGYDIKQFPIPYVAEAIQDLENFYAELTMVGETCSFTRKKKSMDSFYGKGDILSGMTAEIDIVDERMHVRFGKKWIPLLFKQKFNVDKSLDEVVRDIMNRWMQLDDSGLGKLQGNPELTRLTDEEKKSISHFAFCGKIEFKNLNFDQI
ncbi:DUF455 family protein [Paenibacillus sp.]|uniref:DUF455 family protein n=1 Tax=Paenibacillus sp. TaxID=58172 RepID=UPI002D643678|nr:DUF455 family protein [Paenibacillus sp.]HZG58249.1 DUF455 family protein [Paenibacillus sp.]